MNTRKYWALCLLCAILLLPQTVRAADFGGDDSLDGHFFEDEIAGVNVFLLLDGYRRNRINGDVSVKDMLGSHRDLSYRFNGNLNGFPYISNPKFRGNDPSEWDELMQKAQLQNVWYRYEEKGFHCLYIRRIGVDGRTTVINYWVGRHPSMDSTTVVRARVAIELPDHTRCLIRMLPLCGMARFSWFPEPAKTLPISNARPDEGLYISYPDCRNGVRLITNQRDRRRPQTNNHQ